MITNPTPQRKLRAHRPTRSSLRSINSAEHQAFLAQHLTPRDRWLVRMLFEHKVFTTHHIIDLAFPSRRSANLRLHNLHIWGVLHRFQPHRDVGSHPMHYVLDTAGAAVLAHEVGLEPSQLSYKRDREIGRAHSLQLAHTTGCNSLFTRLVHHSRYHHSPGQLTAWWSAQRCARHWGDIVTPDSYGRWHDHARDIEFFLEFDFGTESLARLGSKLPRYEHLARTTDITTPLLIWLPNAQRESTARRALAETHSTLDRPEKLPVATTSADTTTDPLDMSQPRWLRLDDTGRRRVRLPDLPLLWPHLSSLTRRTPTRTSDLSPAAPPALAAPNPIPPPPSVRCLS